MEAAVLIPVKRFTAAKGRLRSVLTVPQRADLARWLATRVVAAAGPLPVFVACDDDDVAAWADDAGAEVLWSPGMGLNGAVDTGRATIAGKGFEHLVIAHSDLPLAHDLDRLVTSRTITLAPDRWRDGTNVVAMPVDADVPANYGGGSFGRHLELAMATDYAVQVLDDPRLSLDIDNPDDVAHPMVRSLLPAWLRTILASRP